AHPIRAGAIPTCRGSPRPRSTPWPIASATDDPDRTIRAKTTRSFMMIAHRRYIVALLVLFSGLPTVRAQQPETCKSMIPASVRAGMLAHEVAKLLLASATFRAQCERIAAAPSVHVDLNIVQPLETPRTETGITHYQFGAIRADVRIAFGQDYREMIAHE